ncbi:hypothetical protein [Nocardia wallacei]|uniref:Uncharacterized protein n=1 Tax=Nocardia wallacei TaxID=480035 RepID=A0A7G1KJK2_9NOCA|nr:hypothetical protein [Nocardia wallacei]BCK54726.1 hypothetical protein NWFMUON74_24980 [Nocardia wallacei]
MIATGKAEVKARARGVEKGSVVLSLLVCSILTGGIAALTQSWFTSAIAFVLIILGLAVTFRILRPGR